MCSKSNLDILQESTLVHLESVNYFKKHNLHISFLKLVTSNSGESQNDDPSRTEYMNVVMIIIITTRQKYSQPMHQIKGFSS